ncbi:MAG: hypothetical protein WC298_04425 [Sideroxydans sp.]|jgi:hypothetical protein
MQLATTKVNRPLHEGNSIPFAVYTDIVWLVIPVFVVLVFSFNFHTLWLIYDLIALLLIVYFLGSRRSRISARQYGVFIVALGYFTFIVVREGHLLMGFLSIWDTFKHLVYVALFIGFMKFHTQQRIEGFSRYLHKICFIFFSIQIVAVIVQYATGVFYDDIAGTFGDGGSHAIAYISILFLVGLILHKSSSIVVVGAVVITLALNILSENSGYVLLMLAAFLGLILVHFSVRDLFKGRNFIFAAMTLIVLYWLSMMTMYSEHSLGEIVIARFIDIFGADADLDTQSVGRGVSLLLASDLGGWFGRGPGAYSIIYQSQGYDFETVYGLQIAISELTHLVSESGFVGYVLTVLVYITFISGLFNGGSYKFVGMTLFVVCTAYSKVLMNESQFFLFLLLMFYFAVLERKSSFYQTQKLKKISA